MPSAMARARVERHVAARSRWLARPSASSFASLSASPPSCLDIFLMRFMLASLSALGAPSSPGLGMPSTSPASRSHSIPADLLCHSRDVETPSRSASARTHAEKLLCPPSLQSPSTSTRLTSSYTRANAESRERIPCSSRSTLDRRPATSGLPAPSPSSTSGLCLGTGLLGWPR